MIGRFTAHRRHRVGRHAAMPAWVGFTYHSRQRCDQCGGRRRRISGLYGRIGAQAVFIARRPQ